MSKVVLDSEALNAWKRKQPSWNGIEIDPQDTVVEIVRRVTCEDGTFGYDLVIQRPQGNLIYANGVPERFITPRKEGKA